MQQRFNKPGLKRLKNQKPALAVCQRCYHLRLTETRAYLRPDGKTTVKVRRTRQRPASNNGRKNPLPELKEDKKRFCLQCIDGNDEVRLWDLGNLASASATPIMTMDLCPEWFISERDPELKGKGLFLVPLFRGSGIHEDFATHLKRGSTNALAQFRRTEEIFGRRLVDKKVPAWVYQEKNDLIYWAYRTKRRAIELGWLKTRTQYLSEDPHLLFVDGEVHFRILLSWLVKFYLGEAVAREWRNFDVIIEGNIDLLLYYQSYPGHVGPVAIVGDYKTIWPESKAENQRLSDHYGHSLQMLLYALALGWMTEIPIGNVLIRPYLATPYEPWEKIAREYRISEGNVKEIALKVFGRFHRFAQHTAKIKMSLPYANMQGASLLHFYQPKPVAEICMLCPRRGLCSATRGTVFAEKLIPPYPEDEDTELNFFN